MLAQSRRLLLVTITMQEDRLQNILAWHSCEQILKRHKCEKREGMQSRETQWWSLAHLQGGILPLLVQDELEDHLSLMRRRIAPV